MTVSICPVLNRVRNASPEDPIPTAEDLSSALQEQLHLAGNAAFDTFVQAQLHAATIWGPERTAHFGQVLRATRVAPKPPALDRWGRARRAANRLPERWALRFLERIAVSETGGAKQRTHVLSAAYLEAMAFAWYRWLRHGAREGWPERPTGATLEAYAQYLLQDIDEPVTESTCASYLERIVAAWRLQERGFASPAVEFVVTRYREDANRVGASTKTGNQIVGASAIYNLGFNLMAEARESPLRGLHAARKFRNGILLSVGSALPQRARALSALAYEKTLFLPERNLIEVRLPGDVLKRPEAEKPGPPFVKIFRNPGLYDVLDEYRHGFRPLFDSGDWLFPSMLDRASAISEMQVGRLSGNLTLHAFGVRIPIHRLRDNVATEASEDLPIGARAVPALLGHSSVSTGQRHYDHAQGIRAAEEHASFLDARRTRPCSLRL
jgi:integrase